MELYPLKHRHNKLQDHLNDAVLQPSKRTLKEVEQEKNYNPLYSIETMPNQNNLDSRYIYKTVKKTTTENSIRVSTSQHWSQFTESIFSRILSFLNFHDFIRLKSINRLFQSSLDQARYWKQSYSYQYQHIKKSLLWKEATDDQIKPLILSMGRHRFRNQLLDTTALFWQSKQKEIANNIIDCAHVKSNSILRCMQRYRFWRSVSSILKLSYCKKTNVFSIWISDNSGVVEILYHQLLKEKPFSLQFFTDEYLLITYKKQDINDERQSIQKKYAFYKIQSLVDFDTIIISENEEKIDYSEINRVDNDDDIDSNTQPNNSYQDQPFDTDNVEKQPPASPFTGIELNFSYLIDSVNYFQSECKLLRVTSGLNFEFGGGMDIVRFILIDKSKLLFYTQGNYICILDLLKKNIYKEISLERNEIHEIFVCETKKKIVIITQDYQIIPYNFDLDEQYDIYDHPLLKEIPYKPSSSQNGNIFPQAKIIKGHFRNELDKLTEYVLVGYGGYIHYFDIHRHLYHILYDADAENALNPNNDCNVNTQMACYNRYLIVFQPPIMVLFDLLTKEIVKQQDNYHQAVDSRPIFYEPRDGKYSGALLPYCIANSSISHSLDNLSIIDQNLVYVYITPDNIENSLKVNVLRLPLALLTSDIFVFKNKKVFLQQQFINSFCFSGYTVKNLDYLRIIQSGQGLHNSKNFIRIDKGSIMIPFNQEFNFFIDLETIKIDHYSSYCNPSIVSERLQQLSEHLRLEQESKDEIEQQKEQIKPKKEKIQIKNQEKIPVIENDIKKNNQVYKKNCFSSTVSSYDTPFYNLIHDTQNFKVDINMTNYLKCVDQTEEERVKDDKRFRDKDEQELYEQQTTHFKNKFKRRKNKIKEGEEREEKLYEEEELLKQKANDMMPKTKRGKKKMIVKEIVELNEASKMDQMGIDDFVGFKNYFQKKLDTDKRKVKSCRQSQRDGKNQKKFM